MTTGQRNRPGRGTQPAGESRTHSVTRPTDSPGSTLAWLHGLVGAGVKHRTLVVALAMSTSSSLRRPFPIDVAAIAAATGYAPSTVTGAIADLIRQGSLKRVRQNLCDVPVFGRWTNNGQSLLRWAPRPALYRITVPTSGGA